MKKFILSFVAVIAFTFCASAQRVSTAQTAIADVAIAAQTATNLFNAVTIDCSKQKDVGIMISTSNTVDQSTSGAINGMMFVRSVDGVNYETNGTYVTWVPVGKSWLNTFTNISANGALSMKILFATNAAASGGNNTNVGSLHVAYAFKIGSP